MQFGWIWNDAEPFDRRSAWIDLLLSVNYEQKTLVFNDNVITVEPGQTITSIRKLADRWKWNKNKVSRFLDRLELDKMIERKSDQNCTLITICNYRKYQEQRDTNEDTNGGTIRDTNEDTNGTPQSLDFTGFDGSCRDTNRDTERDTNRDSNEDTNRAQCKKERINNNIIAMQCIDTDANSLKIILLDGNLFEVNETVIAEYSARHPDLDILREFQLMTQWFEKNPNKRKTGSEMDGFITRWLQRSTNAKNNESRKGKFLNESKPTEDEEYYSFTAW